MRATKHQKHFEQVKKMKSKLTKILGESESNTNITESQHLKPNKDPLNKLSNNHSQQSLNIQILNKRLSDTQIGQIYSST